MDLLVLCLYPLFSLISEILADTKPKGMAEPDPPASPTVNRTPPARSDALAHLSTQLHSAFLG